MTQGCSSVPSCIASTVTKSGFLPVELFRSGLSRPLGDPSETRLRGYKFLSGWAQQRALFRAERQLVEFAVVLTLVSSQTRTSWLEEEPLALGFLKDPDFVRSDRFSPTRETTTTEVMSLAAADFLIKPSSNPKPDSRLAEKQTLDQQALAYP